eukprot:6347714-Alexandrium_andersonii.AAC.1
MHSRRGFPIAGRQAFMPRRVAVRLATSPPTPSAAGAPPSSTTPAWRYGAWGSSARCARRWRPGLRWSVGLN